MAIDWANEHFVRVFTRDTDEELLLSWEARAVWHEMLRKCDQSGLIVTKRGVQGLAALIRVPVEVVERVLQELLDDGRIRSIATTGFVIPNYMEAQFTPRSDRSRKETERTRRRIEALGMPTRTVSNNRAAGSTDENHVDSHESGSRDVTPGHAESRHVTHNITGQDSAVHVARPAPTRMISDSYPEKHSGRSKISETWIPRERERLIAAELGLDCDAEAREFLSYWLSEGKTKADWNRAFESRLHAQAQHSRSARKSDSESPREIPEL